MVYSEDEFHDENAVLRDHLVVECTKLADERTLFSYLRTGLALVVTGTTSCNFLGGKAAHFQGIIAVGMGVITVAVGLAQYGKMRKKNPLLPSSLGGACLRAPGSHCGFAEAIGGSDWISDRACLAVFRSLLDSGAAIGPISIK